MRSPIRVLESLNSKSDQPEYRFQRLYRNLYNPEFYLLAYKNIAQSTGSMTAGVDGKTVANMSIGRIEQIISTLKNHSYQPTPARRTYIQKNNSTKMRPLGIPSTNDKLVQEVVRMILESIYEPTFSNNSHGFRPNRSCHTAMKQIQDTFTGTIWFVEGDIKACFDRFDHHVMIDILRRRVDDENFIALMWKFLKAGYMENWNYHQTYSGTPQGSGISPILANIYLGELDKYMVEYQAQFNIGDIRHRKKTTRYNTLAVYKCNTKKRYREQWETLPPEEKRAAIQEVKAYKAEMLRLPYLAPCDEGFKRIQYCRYADDFLIGVIGSHADAEKIKADLNEFISSRLKLEMSLEKSKVTHVKDKARFLGFDITVFMGNAAKRNKNGELMRGSNGMVQLYVPKEKWMGKLLEYKAMVIRKDDSGRERWKPMHRGKLMNQDDIDIISKVNAEVRGLYNYYCIAKNASVIGNFAFIMKRSMLKTFAAKYNTQTSKIWQSYARDGIFGLDYRTRSGMKRCEFYHGGFARQEKILHYADTLPPFQKYDKPNELSARLKKGVCELCSNATTDIRIHHVRRLKDLKGETAAEQLMIVKNRRTLAVCPDCYNSITQNI